MVNEYRITKYLYLTDKLNYSTLVCRTTGTQTRRLRRLLTDGTRHNNNNGSYGNDISNLVSRCDTQSSGSVQYETASPESGSLNATVEFTET
jgi:hypothetical protein